MRTWAFVWQVANEYNPTRRVEITELRLVLKDAGTYCAYENHLPAGTAFESLRYKTGRKQDTSCILTAVVILRITEHKSEDKIVDFECEQHTCKINGQSGAMVPPHLGTYAGPLKSTAFRNKARKYARDTLLAAKPTHHLIQRGWHLLPDSVDQLQ
jgi:hypothetical protein